MKKRITAVVLLILMTVSLCACGEQKLTDKSADYPGTYVYDNSSMREIATHTLTVNEDGTYTYVRVSTTEERNGTYTGTWEIDETGYLILTGSQSGKTSRGSLNADSTRMNVADLGNAEDTVDSGIYFYQIPEEEPSAAQDGSQNGAQGTVP